MPGRTPARFDEPEPPRGRHGLRARLWLASLLGPLAGALASVSLIAAIVMAGHTLDASVLVPAIALAALIGLVVGLLCGRWISRGVSEGLRRIEQGIGAGHLLEPPVGAPEWGEIGGVAYSVRVLLDAQRELRRSAAELHDLRAAVARAGDAVNRWVAAERWEPLAPAAGGLAPLAESLDRGFAREGEVRAQNLEAARLVRSDLARVIEDAGASADLAEHGYVEATALLTTVREIARLTAELQQPVELPGPPAAESFEAREWREDAAQALEELIRVSGESVQDLGNGLLTVREVVSQVQVLANRATLIALNVVVATGRPGAPAVEGSTMELKQLAGDVRATTERVAGLSRDVEREVESANHRMRGVRDRVLERLERVPVAAAPATPSPQAPSPRVERLREMVQDAARKGERLCESQERVSSAVQRFARRLEEQTRDLDGLIVRLAPMGGVAAERPLAAGSEERGARQLKVVEIQNPEAHEGDEPRGGESRE